MYQFSYAEVMQDSVTDAKERERQVLDRSIEMLAAAREKTKYGREAIEALFYTRRVWVSFIEDLKHPGVPSLRLSGLAVRLLGRG